MYIHVGGDVSIPSALIVGIINLETVSEKDSATLAFMQKIESGARLELMSGDIPRSLIVTLERSYLSPLSSETLQKRWRTNAALE